MFVEGCPIDWHIDSYDVVVVMVVVVVVVVHSYCSIYMCICTILALDALPSSLLLYRLFEEFNFSLIPLLIR